MSLGGSFPEVLRTRFGSPQPQLLEEPEAAAPLSAQIALLAGRHDVAAKAAQVLRATHSPVL